MHQDRKKKHDTAKRESCSTGKKKENKQMKKNAHARRKKQ
jgi:hypothetical protein